MACIIGPIPPSPPFVLMEFRESVATADAKVVFRLDPDGTCWIDPPGLKRIAEQPACRSLCEPVIIARALMASVGEPIPANPEDYKPAISPPFRTQP